MTSPTRERELVIAAAGRLVGVYTEPALDAAAGVLADVHAAGARHGIDPTVWAHTGNMPMACLLAVTSGYRSSIPQTSDEAVALLDEVAEALAGCGVPASRDVLRVMLPDIPGGSPTSGPAGARVVAVTITIDAGWALVAVRDGLSPVVSVAAPHDVAGAQAVARTALAIAAGDAPDPFRRR